MLMLVEVGTHQCRRGEGRGGSLVVGHRDDDLRVEERLLPLLVAVVLKSLFSISYLAGTSHCPKVRLGSRHLAEEGYHCPSGMVAAVLLYR